LSEPDFTYDWSSSHFGVWSRTFSSVQDSVETILEIGSFEGRSAAFFLSFFKNASIVCVDTFEGGAEHAGPDAQFPADMQAVEKRFDSNLRLFGARVRKFKGPSLVMLDQLNRLGERFDVIYVDGDHAAVSAFADAALAWPMLRPGGAMIFDDYAWMPEMAPERRPAAGVDAFLNLVRGEFQELKRGYQVIVRKLEVPASTGATAEPKPPYLPDPALTPPLVSFVVTNRNYAHFVGDAIKSIQNQDYPHFECLVVDDNSDDDSRTVIENSIKGDDRFRSIYLPENLGQLGVTMWVLDRLKGSYVAFVDADDVIFANFASMHVQAHIGFPTPVAVTTSAMAEMNASGQVIQFRDYRATMKNKAKDSGLRPLDGVVRLPTDSERTIGYDLARHRWLDMVSGNSEHVPPVGPRTHQDGRRREDHASRRFAYQPPLPCAWRNRYPEPRAFGLSHSRWQYVCDPRDAEGDRAGQTIVGRPRQHNRDAAPPAR
jgi:predicted O-methyltransferase YrrM